MALLTCKLHVLLYLSVWAGFVVGGAKSHVARANGLLGTGRFIVELEKAPSFGEDTHEPLYASLKTHNIGFKVDKEFRSQGVFNGAALTLDNAKDISALSNTPGVVAIRPVRTYSRPQPIKMKAIDGMDASSSPDTQSTHVMTGVDKLHAEGISGKGIRIGVIDTGVDYTHPALGNGFGPGFKIVGGYDFVGDDYDGTNTPIPDPDPFEQCYGHGTHVTGIIAADPSNPFNISGVAYSASISVYRIFGCTGDVTDDIIVDALLRGVEDGQDILTLSIGGVDSWTEGTASVRPTHSRCLNRIEPEFTTQVVASRIAESGKVVTVAAGNDGASGSWYSSGPGNAISAISVGSVDSIAINLNRAIVEGAEHDPITYYSLASFPVQGSVPIFATSNDTTKKNDACDPLPEDTPNLEDYVVVIRRGTCPFVQKAANAVAKGAKAVIFYDNGTSFGYITVDNVNATLIQMADGEFLVNQFADGVPIRLSFPSSDAGGTTEFPNPEGGLISSFTSYGPSNDFYFKPSVAAPGGNIMSLLPTNKGSYGVASGTSMATPFLAGSAALLLEKLGKSVDTRTLFESTAKIIPATHDTDALFQTVAQQGAGLVQVYNAIYSTSKVWPTELVLNDTAHSTPEHVFTVQNTGNVTKQYQLSHIPAGTAITVDSGTNTPALGPVPLSDAFANVELSTESFSLAPGESQDVTAHFVAPQADSSTFPLYSGFIQVSDGSETVHVTYLGLAASLRDKTVLDFTNITLGRQTPTLLEPSGRPQSTARNYTFDVLEGEGDFPSVEIRLVFGTPLLRLDLVNPDFVLGGSATIETVGVLSEVNYMSRNDVVMNPSYIFEFSDPVFENGTQIPSGSYKLLVRALRVTGNPSNEGDYDSWLSPVIGYYDSDTA
ncbi:hypothetical protein VNI00_003890 [Paramarasmius palmivorus]|uniref:Uncharacterized protein n=1 Tax=Paramarasmius palmivorus TaxID=297713 RepID=A0AAW0DLE6_9AGAR